MMLLSRRFDLLVHGLTESSVPGVTLTPNCPAIMKEHQSRILRWLLGASRAGLLHDGTTPWEKHSDFLKIVFNDPHYFYPIRRWHQGETGMMSGIVTSGFFYLYAFVLFLVGVGGPAGIMINAEDDARLVIAMLLGVPVERVLPEGGVRFKGMPAEEWDVIKYVMRIILPLSSFDLVAFTTDIHKRYEMAEKDWEFWRDSRCPPRGCTLNDLMGWTPSSGGGPKIPPLSRAYASRTGIPMNHNTPWEFHPSCTQHRVMRKQCVMAAG